MSTVSDDAISEFIRHMLGPDFHAGMVYCVQRCDRYAKTFTVEAQMLIPVDISLLDRAKLDASDEKSLKIVCDTVKEHLGYVFKKMPLFKEITDDLIGRVEAAEKNSEQLKTENARLAKFETYYNMHKEMMGTAK